MYPIYTLALSHATNVPTFTRTPRLFLPEIKRDWDEDHTGDFVKKSHIAFDSKTMWLCKRHLMYYDLGPTPKISSHGKGSTLYGHVIYENNYL